VEPLFVLTFTVKKDICVKLLIKHLKAMGQQGMEKGPVTKVTVVVVLLFATRVV